MKLSQSADLTSDYVSTVPLPTVAGQNFLNTECYISGWGKTSATGTLADVLQHTPMNVMTNDNCKRSWGNSLIIQSHICLAVGTSSACNVSKV
ncbi:hypothetical protein KUTeg_004025 [Tegillarca granosa]|uniref:Peptidase S1 domain-containing protein n=1 Tax=Tegillarca granosa TaxID=220873 RepID=A0ABQ9FNQ5_TEGGR|nr:hypothetical protein KUTeg_004025 [Tegillarca granosa]